MRGGSIAVDERRRRPPSAKRLAQHSLFEHIQQIDGEPWELEYLFAPLVPNSTGKKLIHIRRWKFDIACPALLLYVEVEGGMFGGGRHGGQPSVVRDLEKRNAAACLGWRGVHVTPTQVNHGQAIIIVRALLGLEAFQL